MKDILEKTKLFFQEKPLVWRTKLVINMKNIGFTIGFFQPKGSANHFTKNTERSNKDLLNIWRMIDLSHCQFIMHLPQELDISRRVWSSIKLMVAFCWDGGKRMAAEIGTGYSFESISKKPQTTYQINTPLFCSEFQTVGSKIYVV